MDREALKKIGTDSIITVKTRGLMGEKYVDITPSRVYSEVPAKRLYGTQLPKLDDVMQKAGTVFRHPQRDHRPDGQGGRVLGTPAQGPEAL